MLRRMLKPFGWKVETVYFNSNLTYQIGCLVALSGASPNCQWEVKEAERLSKRIMPVLHKPLDGVVPPPQLAQLHYTRFDPNEDGSERSIMESLGALRRALKAAAVRRKRVGPSSRRIKAA